MKTIKFILIGISTLLGAYLLGIKKGKENEKASQNQKILANVARANSARAALNDPAVVRRLREKYTRK